MRALVARSSRETVCRAVLHLPNRLGRPQTANSNLTMPRRYRCFSHPAHVGSAELAIVSPSFPSPRRDLASYLHTSRSQIEDCTQEWTFPDNSFDYIHIRLLVGSIADWGALFKEAYRCLAPGGWIESHEGSPNLHSDNEPIPTTTAMGQWGPLFVSGGRVLGRSFTVVEDETQRKAIEEAGFVSIGEKKTTVCSALREGRTFC